MPAFHTAFDGDRLIARGALSEVAHKLASPGGDAQPLVIDDATGRVVDLDLRGGPEAAAARYAPEMPDAGGEPDGVAAARGRGRPRLGVVAREVTLLPRHWAWLATQPGGSSQALRRLVEAARRADETRGRPRAARDAAYRAMSVLAGDRPGFEEASRALFAGDGDRFARLVGEWPADIATYLRGLAGSAFES